MDFTENIYVRISNFNSSYVVNPTAIQTLLNMRYIHYKYKVYYIIYIWTIIHLNGMFFTNISVNNFKYLNVPN